MAFRGIDLRQSGDRILFRVSLKDGSGAKLTTGTTSLFLYEVQNDGTLFSYDFNSNTFKSTALTTPSASMTHRQGNNSTTNTGLWTYSLTTVSGFTRGNVYLCQVTNSGAFPTDQEREFQYGDGEGDFTTTSAGATTVGTNNDKTGYTASTVSDKTGYALTAGEHTLVAADAQTGLTAQGYTTARAGYLDTLNGLVAAIWASGSRTLTGFGTLVSDIWAAVVDSAGVGTLLSRLSALRAGYLDNLNVSGLVASSAEATAIQNNTRTVRVVPDTLERPDSGSTAFRIELLLYDEIGNMEAPDSAPTIGVVNQGGSSRDANLDSTTMTLVSTGRYRSIYTIDTVHAIEELVFAFSVTEGGTTRIYANGAQVVDTTAVDFTSSDRTTLNTIAADYQQRGQEVTFPASVPSGYATSANQTTLLNRLGAITGTGVNTVLGFFKALLSKVASVPTDIGGTFDPATDSTEAIRDRGDAAWTGSTPPTVMEIRAEMDSNSTRLAHLQADLTDTPPTSVQVRQELDTNSTKLANITGPVALEATLTAIKGGGWTTQTLVAIQAAIALKLAASAYTAPDNTGIASAASSAATAATQATNAATSAASADSKASTIIADIDALPSSSDFVAAIKADEEWQTILANVNGVFTFDPDTGILILKNKAGDTTLATLTLTLNPQKIVLSRASA